MQCGFTLIELLVVVVIVMILAALVTAAIRPIKGTMQRTQCAQNLKQIGAGLFNYAADHENCLPPIYLVYPYPSGGQENMWGALAWPYIYGNTPLVYLANDTQMSPRIPGYPNIRPNVFRCFATRDKTVHIPTLQNATEGRMSYGLNNNPIAADSWNYRTVPTPLARVTKASQAAMVLEASYGEANYTVYRNNVGLIPHSGGSNILFYDGHVEWRAYANIPLTTNADVFWMGN